MGSEGKAPVWVEGQERPRHGSKEHEGSLVGSKGKALAVVAGAEPPHRSTGVKPWSGGMQREGEAASLAKPAPA